LVAAAEAVVVQACERLLGWPVAGIHRIKGGRNNQVFRIECAGPRGPAQYVAKHYFASPEDPRDRLGTEYGALQWLRSCGLDRIPAAVGIDQEARCAVYEFLPGTPASQHPASDRDVQEAVAFLADLRTLARQSGPNVAPAASEAHFSIDGVIQHVSGRAERLRSVPGEAPQSDALQRFMTSRFTPLADSLAAWTTEQIGRDGLSRDEDLPLPERTLSPSDFGFHNALRDGEGRLAFVDFEYFGWDDPAKTIADFLLHPGMDMTAAQRRAFAAGMTALFADAPQFKARARLLYPWFGLKWALILLNEYLPHHLGRRHFAGDADADRVHILRERLESAERMLARVDAEYRQNPYLAS
jgi:hypothetical protein